MGQPPGYLCGVPYSCKIKWVIQHHVIQHDLPGGRQHIVVRLRGKSML
jgi:hypothetical protein